MADRAALENLSGQTLDQWPGLPQWKQLNLDKPARNKITAKTELRGGEEGGCLYATSSREIVDGYSASA